MFKKFPSLSSIGSDGNTAFLRAARAGHLDKVLEHLNNNIDINTSNSNGLNALHLASKDGHVDVVTELLKRGASVDAATKKGNTALHIASLAGQEEVVKLLVASGAAVNVQSQNGFTPLYMAAQENHDNVVRFLLANGANQSLATEDGFTPLAVAMQQGHDKVVTVLLENDTRGKVRLPALHIAAKKDDCKAAALLLQNEHNPDVTSKSGFTPLHIAAHYGNESIANLLLNRGADVNYAAKHNITPLHVAAKWGKTNMVSLLLEKGANIESKTRDGLTPLHCAARSGHEQVVDMLLERGAPISSKTKNGLAPLHMSSQGDHVDAARILLYHRAPVDEVTVDYLTALHVAAHCGHVRVAKLLLDRNADSNARALNGFTPLHIACKKNRLKVVELLLKNGASIEATTESGLTPLHVASFMGCMNIVIHLLQHEANPDVPTVRGETPLHLAARANQIDIIRILLRNGAKVDARAREQQTPLHIAARLGNADIAMLLLQHGASVDSATKDMYTALHIAGKEGQDEVASALLDNGASLTATTKKGFTPLHLAAKYGNMKVAKLLLQRDAPVDAQGKNGVTPLHVASHYDHQNVALLLLDKGASPHATAKNGHTPLHIAARKNQMDIATTLLEYGAKADAESKAGFTPLHLSAQEGHTDMSNLLIENHADTNHKAKNGLTPMHLCAQEDRVNVASVLEKNGAEIDSTTKGGYTPLHVACHFGQMNMVRFLLEHGAKVNAATSIGYTPLHHAAQQGHTAIVSQLLENGAQPNAQTNQGQTPLSIAQKLGYVGAIEALKVVTDPSKETIASSDEKYRVVAPETMQETFMSDSEDEGGEDTNLSDQPYRYLTVDEMKSLGDDSLPIDVTRDERIDSNKDSMAPPTAVDDTISPQHVKENYQQFAVNYAPDNVDIAKHHPIHVGFLVSFLVDARGGAMRGCRHSGVKIVVPPRKASMPMRVTCRYLKRDRLSHPPPLMEGEALASRILELGPVGAKFLGPVIIEVPHFASLRGAEREIVILRSDNGETWREHTVEASDEAVHQVLSESFDGEELEALEDSSNSTRTTRILTTDFPQFFAVVSRIRQEVHAIGPEGGMVSSTVVPQVQAVFPQGALTKKIKVGLQAQPIPAELTAKLLGNRVAVSPIVTVEPRRRKFHKPITLTIPVPQAANKGMINQYSGDAPTLRLLCSITGGTTRAQWEDVTGSTPLTFVNDCVSFTTTVSARFWLMDCRNIQEATKMATELYKEAIHVPFMAKFVVFAKRVDVLEARLRVFCMTDDKEDKTLEQQEHFTEVAKSRDVEVLEGKPQFVEFAGNLIPVTKSGDQLQLGFKAFRENRLPFTVRVKDPHADMIGRILFMREPKVAKGEAPQQPVCILNIVLPETIIPEAEVSEQDLVVALGKKYGFHVDGSYGHTELYRRPDLRLSDISNLLSDDWIPLAAELGISTSDVNILKSEHPTSSAQQAMAMLKFWLQKAGNKATATALETALSKIGRDDISRQCIFNVDDVDHAVKKVHLDQSGFDSLKEELGPSRDASMKRETSLDITYDEQDIMKESESVEELVQQEKKKPFQDEIIRSSMERIGDVDESKYIGEEKVVEEEHRTVAQLKEIFAQDKRDRQYERQPRHIEETKETVTTVEETENGVKVTKVTTIKEPTVTIVTDKGVKKKTEEEETAAKKKAAEDQRRDSALFQGVSNELVRLETTHKVICTEPELLSPKVSKTPPPSPAEFKDHTGEQIWHRGDSLTAEPYTSPQGLSGESQPDQGRATVVQDDEVTDGAIISSNSINKFVPEVLGKPPSLITEIKEDKLIKPTGDNIILTEKIHVETKSAPEPSLESFGIFSDTPMNEFAYGDSQRPGKIEEDIAPTKMIQVDSEKVQFETVSSPFQTILSGPYDDTQSFTNEFLAEMAEKPATVDIKEKKSAVDQFLAEVGDERVSERSDVEEKKSIINESVTEIVAKPVDVLTNIEEKKSDINQFLFEIEEKHVMTDTKENKSSVSEFFTETAEKPEITAIPANIQTEIKEKTHQFFIDTVKKPESVVSEIDQEKSDLGQFLTETAEKPVSVSSKIDLKESDLDQLLSETAETPVSVASEIDKKKSDLDKFLTETAEKPLSVSSKIDQKKSELDQFLTETAEKSTSVASEIEQKKSDLDKFLTEIAEKPVSVSSEIDQKESDLDQFLTKTAKKPITLASEIDKKESDLNKFLTETAEKPVSASSKIDQKKGDLDQFLIKTAENPVSVASENDQKKSDLDKFLTETAEKPVSVLSKIDQKKSELDQFLTETAEKPISVASEIDQKKSDLDQFLTERVEKPPSDMIEAEAEKIITSIEQDLIATENLLLLETEPTSYEISFPEASSVKSSATQENVGHEEHDSQNIKNEKEGHSEVLSEHSKTESFTSVPYVTTPTLKRRGLIGSQSLRLDKNNRPAPIDVTNLSRDDEFGESDYIVTEPEEVTSHSVRINSSPEILSEPVATITSEYMHNEAKEHHRPLFHIESEDDDSFGQSSQNIDEVVKHQEESVLHSKYADEFDPFKETDEFSNKFAESSVLIKTKTLVETPIKSEALIESEAPEDKHDMNLELKEEDKDRKLRRVERRFERMASETNETGNNTKEFECMVSQLSTEEVAEYEKEYLQLLDEGGLTPSEDWESKDASTPSGELNEVYIHCESSLALDTEALPKIVVDTCETASIHSSDEEAFIPLVQSRQPYNENQKQLNSEGNLTSSADVCDNADSMAIDILEEALAESIILQSNQELGWMFQDNSILARKGDNVSFVNLSREPCSVEQSPLGYAETEEELQIKQKGTGPQLPSTQREVKEEPEGAVALETDTSKGIGTLSETSFEGMPRDDQMLKELLKTLEDEKKGEM